MDLCVERVLAVVAAAGGAATTAQILAAVTPRALERAVIGGQVRRLRRGLYAVPTLDVPLASAAALTGVVSHASAAVQHGIALLETPTALHVTVLGSGTRKASDGVVLHRTRHLPLSDLDGLVTSVTRTVIDCATTMPFVPALVVADSALARRLVTHDQVLGAARARAGPGRARCLRVLRTADARSESPSNPSCAASSSSGV